MAYAHYNGTSVFTTAQKVEAIYGYTPSTANCIAFMVLFGLATIACLIQNIMYKSHRYLYLLPFTACLEVIGYGFRYATISNPSLGNLVLSFILLIVVPILTALVNYITVAKLMQSIDKGLWCIKPKWLSTIFFFSDIVGFLIQGGAAASLANGGGTSATTILSIGLVIQLAFFSWFCYIEYTVAFGKDWRFWDQEYLQGPFICLFVTSFLFLLRNCYRVAEYASGSHSAVATTEAYFITFDGTLMFVVFCVYIYYHFARTVPSFCSYNKGGSELPTTNRDVIPKNVIDKNGENGVEATFVAGSDR